MGCLFITLVVSLLLVAGVLSYIDHVLPPTRVHGLSLYYTGCIFIACCRCFVLYRPCFPPNTCTWVVSLLHWLYLYCLLPVFCPIKTLFFLQHVCMGCLFITLVVSLLLVVGVLSYKDHVLPPTHVHGLYLYYTGCIFIACCRCFDLYGSCFPSNTCTWAVSLLHWLYLYCLLPVFCPIWILFSLQHVYMGCLFITVVVSLLLVAGVLSYIDPVFPPTRVHELSLYYTCAMILAPLSAVTVRVI